ncbi:MAG: VCBS repeat-containing protein, partial [bacterium]|nr:VCBS repeat-containing protein [bacterium]
DGDLDILLTGYDGSKAISKTYTNYGDGSYIVKENPLITGINDGSVAFGDINNDGNLDILLTGWDSSNKRISKTYTNDGSGNYIVKDNPQLAEVGASSVAFGDIDNDGNLDILLTGYYNNPISKTYRNNRKIPNTAPSAPANPKATFNANDNTVDLSWDESTDPNQTKGLSYNIY